MFVSELKSLGYQSDLLVLSFESDIIEHDDCIQVATPSNPSFYWGNFLIFPNKPSIDNFEIWTHRFKQLFPNAKHISLGWDAIGDKAGDVSLYIKNGFELSELSVLTAKDNDLVEPKKDVINLTVRPLVTDEDWRKATDLQIECNEDYPPEEFDNFKKQQMLQHRKNSDAGFGHWYGAFINDELVADLGIYSGNGVSRFQSVETKKEYRRQGIAGQLVYHASRHVLSQHPSNTVVIVAETNEPAVLVYEGVGFTVSEREYALLKRP